jgi:hypothetical protein
MGAKLGICQSSQNETISRNNCTRYLLRSYYNRDMFRLINGHPQAILIISNIKIKVTIPTTDPLCIAKSNCMYYRQMLQLIMFRVNLQFFCVKMVIKS